jgi:hypothetical protein
METSRKDEVEGVALYVIELNSSEGARRFPSLSNETFPEHPDSNPSVPDNDPHLVLVLLILDIKLIYLTACFQGRLF